MLKCDAERGDFRFAPDDVLDCDDLDRDDLDCEDLDFDAFATKQHYQSDFSRSGTSQANYCAGLLVLGFFTLVAPL